MIVHSAAKSVSIPGPDMSALIARLEAAEAGSRELDAHVEVAARAFEAAKTGLAREHWAVWRASSSGIVGDGFTQYAAAPVTTSLDAALALAERVLPGWYFGAQQNRYELSTGPEWTAYLSGSDRRAPEIEGDGPTAPLALCGAILRAIPNGYEAEGVVSPILKAKAQGR